MSGPPPLPWRYPYQFDRQRSVYRHVLRPVVSARLRATDVSSSVISLVDSGSESTLAAPWLASDAAVDLRNPKYVTDLGVGGDRLPVHFVDMAVRLHHPDGDDDHYIE